MIRSALPADSGGRRATDASDLPATHLQATRILEQFGNLLDASGDDDTQRRLADLRNSIDQYWDSLPDIREQNGKLSHPAPPAPGSLERRQIRHIARQISALNRKQQDRAEAQLHAEQKRLQGELLISSILSLVVVVMLIAGISYRIRKTEHYAETQFKDVVQARAKLREFTAQLEHVQEEERRNLSRELHDEFGRR
jgi:signal transduction histidine kinase